MFLMSKLFLVFLDDPVLGNGHLWLFNLHQSMLMINDILASTAQIEVIAEDTLVPDS